MLVKCDNIDQGANVATDELPELDTDPTGNTSGYISTTISEAVENLVATARKLCTTVLKGTQGTLGTTLQSKKPQFINCT